MLDELAALGIRIAIDDYGTGYSSLAYLHRLPVQELKIDRSFVTNLPNEPSNRIIVRSSFAMARSLGLSVVAEGAEDEVTCAMLADAGCDFIQGYSFAKPMGADDLKAWLLQGASLEFTPLDTDATEDSVLVLSSLGKGRIAPGRPLEAPGLREAGSAFTVSRPGCGQFAVFGNPVGPNFAKTRPPFQTPPGRLRRARFHA